MTTIIDSLILYETLAELYYERFHRLAPGKYEAPETGRDSCGEENRTQFDVWVKTQALTDALQCIADLTETIKCLREEPRP